MKKIIISFFFICSCTYLFAQDFCTNDSTKYLNAYKYIVDDSINQGKNINVSDTIVDLDRIWFLDNLDSLLEEKEIVKKLTKYSWFPNFYSQNIANLFNCKKMVPSKTILFFSLIEKNTLCADLFDNKGSLNEFNYNWIASQNRSHMYLFFFESNGNIKYIFRKEICYSF